MNGMRLALLLTTLAGVLMLNACAGRSAELPYARPLVVFLVRHAEKVGMVPDPGLTAAGKQRVAVLADFLRSARLEQVHSTDTRRTRETAGPPALVHGLPVELYDAVDLPGLAEKLQRRRGRHLVVGHSNTTPQLVGLLGGEPGPPIVEHDEYDRLYIVVVEPGGTGPTTVLLRYGAGSIP